MSKVISKAQAAIIEQARVQIKPCQPSGFVLELERMVDGEVREATSLAGFFGTRGEADEAAVAVLTALAAIKRWER